MARTNRLYLSGYPHEICFRVKEGLPFPCLELVKTLLESAMARSLRGGKVVLCHYVWMANHLHMLVVVKDPTECKRFYEELEKKVTDYVKRLLGVQHLSLWEKRPTVAPILDIDEVKRIIAYDYANPARADLVRTIDHYPGLTSWKEFKSSPRLDSTHTRSIPWIRCPKVKRIGRNILTRRMDKKLSARLRESTTIEEPLVVKPNYWMKSFDLAEEDVARVNAEILSKLQAQETDAEKLRAQKGKSVMGPRRLREERFYKPHTPEKKERKIFVRCSDLDLRRAFIQHVKALCGYCRRLFRERRFDEWPPGMFRPPMGVLASAIAF